MAEDLGKRIEAFGQNVWKKAQGAVDIVGMNSDIGVKTRELTQLYAEIGKQYCIAHKDEAQTEFPELCAKANALAEEITTLQETILYKRGFVKCAGCGAAVTAEAAFCPSCGSAMPHREPEAEADEANASCPKCGARMEQDAQFCQSCGAKRE